MGKWRNYLIELQKKGVDWTDPALLQNRFGISEKAAQQIITARKAEIDDAAELELAKQEWEDVNNGTS